MNWTVYLGRQLSVKYVVQLLLVNGIATFSWWAAKHLLQICSKLRPAVDLSAAPATAGFPVGTVP